MQIITQNVVASMGNDQLGIKDVEKKREVEKVFTDVQVERVSEEAATVAISETQGRQLGELEQRSQDVREGMAFCSIVGRSLTEVLDLMQEEKDLLEQVDDQENEDCDKDSINDELAELSCEIDDVLANTRYNGTAVFDEEEVTVGGSLQEEGAVLEETEASDSDDANTTATKYSYVNGMLLKQTVKRVSSTEGAYDTYRVSYSITDGDKQVQKVEMRVGGSTSSVFSAALNPGKLSTSALNIAFGSDIDAHKAKESLSKLEDAMDIVSRIRESFGQVSDHLELNHKWFDRAREDSMQETESYPAAEVDKIMSESTKNILAKPEDSMEAQANQQHKSVLGLLY